eukprot:Selendium_serpulae@DN5040_c0_g1_i1.p5
MSPPAALNPSDVPMLRVLDHPLVQCHLTTVRNKHTVPSEFRRSVDRLSILLASAATDRLGTEDCAIETPLTATTGKKLANRIGLVPIMRAGIGMVEPMLNLIPRLRARPDARHRRVRGARRQGARGLGR